MRRPSCMLDMKIGYTGNNYPERRNIIDRVAGIEYKNINHETLIPTLVKAMQELKSELDTAKAEIEILKQQ